MPVVLVLTALAILGGVVVVAMGRGGELEYSLADSASCGRDLATAADMAAFRPPAAFLGYSAQATDEALRRMSRAVADRDAELSMLRREVAMLRARQQPAEDQAAAEADAEADPAEAGPEAAGPEDGG
jgi:hypothetical protein